MKKLTSVIFLFCAVTAVSPVFLQAQHFAQAVMEVRVEVIAGSSVVSVSSDDLSLFVTHTDSSGIYEIDLGQHILNSPNGMDIIVTTDRVVQVSSDTDHMTVTMEMNQEPGENGELMVSLNGTVNTFGSDGGLYVGNQLTRIEYD